MLKKRVKFSGKNFPRFPQLKLRKRAQFFILAALILSAVVVSLTLGVNYARFNKEPESFYDSSYEIKSEAGGVLDYEIYYGFDAGANLEEFVDEISKDLRDNDTDSNFLFIYGNASKTNVRNYGRTGGGRRVISNIYFGGMWLNVSETCDELGGRGCGGWVYTDLVPGVDKIKIELGGQNYSFSVSEHKRVIFIREKQFENETYVDIR